MEKEKGRGKVIEKWNEEWIGKEGKCLEKMYQGNQKKLKRDAEVYLKGFSRIMIWRKEKKTKSWMIILDKDYGAVLDVADTVGEAESLRVTSEEDEVWLRCFSKDSMVWVEDVSDIPKELAVQGKAYSVDRISHVYIGAGCVEVKLRGRRRAVRVSLWELTKLADKADMEELESYLAEDLRKFFIFDSEGKSFDLEEAVDIWLKWHTFTFTRFRK